ncbi:hypothetical protein DESUT3_12150 [Desulfuromonas versatilis]|uniref:Metallo-beta-lactamase domain-containing protein n=1 Tax=Desulfuromonas versatilis TaxID=2802975 RepID=A0ABM8HTW7_9BACT|nr:MBL fold metallo-hydrolase [Desulfuromonas versatilis]BCR04146.1 hypothetical protein DESUT3_12150 [Desulfuromonas versatilis]
MLNVFSIRTLLVLTLLCLVGEPAWAKLTLGLVPGGNRLLQTEPQAQRLTSFLENRLGEPVQVRIFEEEQTLYDWLVRYQTVDLAVFSRPFFEQQRPWDFQHLADYLGGGRQPSPLVARRGLAPRWLREIPQLLFAMEADREGSAALRELGIQRFVPPGTPISAAPPATELKPSLLGRTEQQPVQQPSAPPAETGQQPAADQQPVAAPAAEAPPPAPEMPPTEESPPAAVTSAPPPPPSEPAPPPPAPPVVKPAPAEPPRAKIAPQQSYQVEKLTEGIFAAIAKPGSRASANAFFVVGDAYVIAGGAHMTPEAIADLSAAIAGVTQLPLRYFILAHHHKGYSHIDFDFPPEVDVIMSWQAWQAVDGEVRKASYPVLFYSDGLTLKLGGRTIILTNMGKGHSEGDTLVFIPEASVLFTGDLAYVKSAAFMGDGHMQDWVLALEFMERLGAAKVIPGYGPVGTGRDLGAFKDYLKAFLTEVLKHIEAGDTLEQTLRKFSLPEYQNLEGYARLLRPNLERAYRDLQQNLLKQ